MPKRKSLKDPHAEREASKYDHPIPSREYILDFLQDKDSPISYEKLRQALQLDSSEEEDGLRRRLRAMLRDGQLLKNRRGHYCLPQRMQLSRGRVIGHKDGFGFVVPEEGGDDLFLSPRNMCLVFDGDKVLVRVSRFDDRGRAEAEIVEILERNTQRIVGRFFREAGVAFVVPDNKRMSQNVLVSNEGLAANHGQIVVVELSSYPTRRKQAIGSVIMVLGDHRAPGMEIDIVINVHDLRCEWPAAVSAEVDSLQEVISDAELAKRQDLREYPFVTIDGEDAKDFDDAVFCQRNHRGTGWQLWVVIADVGHYVAMGSELDKEAQLRANSVYFPGHVLPMLPEKLSNDLCSLKPHEQRLVLACQMSINAEGKLTRYQFYPAVIRSHARLTYDEVASYLKSDETVQFKQKIGKAIDSLYGLFQVLHSQREVRGAIDFDKPESKIVFDTERKIKRIERCTRNEAHQMIEECMLMANLATAKFLKKSKLPVLYRVHEPPAESKLAEVKVFLGELGLNLPGGQAPESGDYAQLLHSVSNRPDFDLIQTVLLRSLSQANYSPEIKGHFGLAFPIYTHFTSPIRRYPDLLIHRTIVHLLNYQGQTAPHCYPAQEVQSIGEHCSLMERRADEATRDAVASLKCEFMLQRVGEVFPGMISSVTSFGVFVELQDIFVEGLVHITALANDYYHFDATRHRLQGERTGTIYRLGDELSVKVVRVDLDEKKIDFELASQASTRTKKPRRRKSK